MIRVGVFLLAWLVALPALAFEFPGGQIQIPDDFDGPISDTIGDDTKVFAFRKRNGEGLPDAQLQITIWAPSRELPAYTETELRSVAGLYLQQFFGGIERTRDNVTKHEPDFIEISGVPTARMTWQGKASDEEIQGTFYSLIHDSRVIILHSQDLVDNENGYGEQINQAFESLTLVETE